MQASSQAFNSPFFTQEVTSRTPRRRGGPEQSCGEVRNTSPYPTTLSANLAFTASVSVTGGVNLTIVKDWVTTSYSVNTTTGVSFNNAVSVGPVPPGKTATIYCYAIGEYISGVQSTTWNWGEPDESEPFTAFIPKSFGYRISYY